MKTIVKKLNSEEKNSFLQNVCKLLAHGFGVGDSAPAITFDNRDKLIEASENSFFNTNVN